MYGDDGSTPLSPHTNAPHAESFKVATRQGIAGFYPYMGIPQGRRGKVDPIRRKTDKGQMQVRVFDQRTDRTASNLSRWVTAFVGDEDGKNNLLGRKVFVEESLDGGSTWEPFFTGRVQDVNTDGRLWITLDVRDMSEKLDRPVFGGGDPHASVTYAGPTSLLPLGPSIDYGPFDAAPTIPATVKSWSVSGKGSGKYLVVNDSALDRRDGNRYAATMRSALQSRLEDVPLPGPDDPEGVHPTIEVEVTSGGSTGRFRLGVFRIDLPRPLGGDGLIRAYVWTGTGEDQTVDALGLVEHDPSHPDYMAMPADDTSVEFRLIHTGEPDDDAPFYIDNVHPVTLMKDMLDGKFSSLNVDGTVKDAIAYDSTSTSALEGDASLGTGRFQVTEEGELNKWLEKYLCVPYNLAYYLNASGEVVPVDMRPPTSLAGLPTLDNADVDARDAPSWGVPLDSAASRIDVTYYRDFRPEPWDQPIITGASFDSTRIVPHRVTQSDHLYIELDVGSVAVGEGKPYKIDALGFRSAGGALEFLEGLAGGLFLAMRLRRVAEQYRQFMSGGVAMARIPCRRTSTVDAIDPGDVVIVDVDELPDPATNRRGGPRVMRCVERTGAGVRIELVFADLGPNSTAVAPTLGSVTATTGREKSAIDVGVTLNADGEPAVIEIAVVDSGGSIPAEDASAWLLAERVTSSGTYTIAGLPSGHDVWVRVRTEPTGADGPKLPSGWVNASTAVALSGIPAPTSVAAVAGYPTGNEHRVKFTPGDSTFLTRVYLDGTHVETLPGGSKAAHVTDLDPSTSYTLELEHDDGSGGRSSKVSHAFTTTGTRSTAPDLGGIEVLVGNPGDVASSPPGDPASPTAYGVAFAIFPGDAQFWTEWERAPDDGSGSPDAANSEIVGAVGPGVDVFVDDTPPEDAHVHYRARHVLDGFTDGDWTSWHKTRAAKLPAEIPRAPQRTKPLMSLDVRVDESTGEVIATIDGEPEVASVKLALDTASYPASESGTAYDTDANGDLEQTLSPALDAGETGYVTATFYDEASGAGDVLGTLRASATYSSVFGGDDGSHTWLFSVSWLADDVYAEWNLPSNTASVDRVEVRVGADFATGTTVYNGKGESFRIPVETFDTGHAVWNNRGPFDLHLKAFYVNGDASAVQSDTLAKNDPADMSVATWLDPRGDTQWVFYVLITNGMTVGGIDYEMYASETEADITGIDTANPPSSLHVDTFEGYEDRATFLFQFPDAWDAFSDKYYRVRSRDRIGQELGDEGWSWGTTRTFTPDPETMLGPLGTAPGAPANDPVPSSAVTPTFYQDADGNVRCEFGFTYSQPSGTGGKKADGVQILVHEGGGTESAFTDDDVVDEYTGLIGGTMRPRPIVPPGANISIGLRAYRKTTNGVETGSIVCPASSPDWQDLPVPASKAFHKDNDDLSDVPDGGGYRKVGDTYVDVQARPHTLYNPSQGADTTVDYLEAGAEKSNAAMESSGRIKSQEYIPIVNTGGRKSAADGFTGDLVTAHSDGDVDVASHTLKAAGKWVSYGSGTVATGESSGTKVYIYRDDPDYTGAGSYQYTTDPVDVVLDGGRYHVGTVTIPSSGSSGGSSGGGWCVAANMYVRDGRLAQDVGPGATLDTLVEREDGWRVVEHPVLRTWPMLPQPCVRVEAAGAAVVVSRDTPMTLEDGSSVPAHDVGGHAVPVVLEGDLVWALATVEDAGVQVVAPINVDDRCFAAGEHASRRIMTHNVEEPKV